MANIIKSPDTNVDPSNRTFSTFLAGSIENGNAIPWHDQLANLVMNKIKSKLPREDQSTFDRITFYNPRRAEWKPEPNSDDLKIQINWELERLLTAVDIAFFYFQKGTISPISLLELGLCLGNKQISNVVIVCDPGYFRATNVEVTAGLFGVTICDTLEEGAKELSDILVAKILLNNKKWKE